MTDAVRIDRVLLATPERVWDALTRAEALTAWFWPARMGTQIKNDLKIDGGYRIEATEPAMAVTGRYLEIVPPQRLVFTFQWDGEEEESLVTIELSEVDGGQTRLLLVHEPRRESHEQGWNDCLDRLPAFLMR